MGDHLPAGDFTVWLWQTLGAFRGERDADVPCDGCIGCCTSAQFIHVEPDESDTLAHVPAELLFPAPGLPRGHVLMGFDERGHCPMLTDDRCSIYEHRPRTCRTYDCRVFAAAGLQPTDKPAIAERVARWQFAHPRSEDHVHHEAVVAAAQYLERRRGDLPVKAVPTNTTQLAVLAVGMHEVFVADPEPAVEAVAVELRRLTGAGTNIRPRARPPHQSDRRSGPRATSRPDTPADRADPA